MTECQKAFEKWVSFDYSYIRLLNKRKDGNYITLSVHLKWKAWQAAWDAKQC